MPDGFAQQDPQYSQYMFNQLSINPAYAGSKEAISSSIFLRRQWVGVDGGPATGSLTVHGPMAKKKVEPNTVIKFGLGFLFLAVAARLPR